MLPISVCIIAKNEEKYIEECLKRLIPYQFELIVTDTGSTDRTVSIAKKYTDHIYHYDWNNDFSAARNFGISKATNDWILSIDCDELLESTDISLMEQLMQKINIQQIGMFLIKNIYLSENEESILNERVARFFHRSHAHFTGIIHEQITPFDLSTPSHILIPMEFLHYGYYSKNDKEKKALRDIALLKESVANHQATPYDLFQLGQSYYSLHNYEDAKKYFEEALSYDLNPDLDYVQHLVESYGYTLLEQKEYALALQFESIYPDFCKRADFVFLMGIIYRNNALFDDAIAQFNYATTISNYAVEGVNSYRAYYNIGVIYECLGNHPEAISYYKKCGSYSPARARLDALQ